MYRFAIFRSIMNEITGKCSRRSAVFSVSVVRQFVYKMSTLRSMRIQDILEIIDLDDDEASIYADTDAEYHGERNEEDDSSEEYEGELYFFFILWPSIPPILLDFF